MEKRETGIPFLVAGETPNPLSLRAQPEGHYDDERQIWIDPEGQPLAYEMSRGGSESTWNATSTQDADSSGDHDDYD